jgi:hypothetical protein
MELAREVVVFIYSYVLVCRQARSLRCVMVTADNDNGACGTRRRLWSLVSRLCDLERPYREFTHATKNMNKVFYSSAS